MLASELFKCQKCGSCCQGYGGTVVSENDLKAIADYTHIPLDELKENYCRLSGKKFILAQRDDGYCIFWDDLCRIHPVKPAMCRRWPFIRSVLVDPQNWYIMAGFCPGMLTDVSETVIKACVQKEILLQSEKYGE